MAWNATWLPVALSPSDCRKVRPPSGPDQHVVPHPDGWAVLADGADRPEWVCADRDAAVEEAREIAHALNSRVVVHGPDGRIERSLLPDAEP